MCARQPPQEQEQQPQEAGQRRRHSVHFSPDPNDVYSVPAVSDIENRETIWLTRQDIIETEENLRETLSRLLFDNDDNDKSEDDDARGLEWYTSPRAEERLSHRARGLLAVLREQSRLVEQRHCGTATDLDEDRLAWMYQRETEHCLSKACMQGIRDEMEAFRIYNEEQQEEEIVEIETKDNVVVVVDVASQESLTGDEDALEAAAKGGEGSTSTITTTTTTSSSAVNPKKFTSLVASVSASERQRRDRL